MNISSSCVAWSTDSRRLCATTDIAERCTFKLRDLSYQYPDEIVMTRPQRRAHMSSTTARAQCSTP